LHPPDRDRKQSKTRNLLVRLRDISGGWRTQHGARAWLRIRGYISTAHKNGLHIITALRDAITGNLWLPTNTEMA
jgi:transposase